MEQVHSHETVLLEAAVNALAIKPAGIYVDGTFGRGGHSQEILKRLGADGRLLAMDKDPEAVRVGLAMQAQDTRFEIEQGSFAMLGRISESRGWKGRIDGILLDLGVSSPQLDDPQRGFSFRFAGPLDMRMDPESGVSAAEWLATAEEGEIARVLKVYGEERFARRIARAIGHARQQGDIQTTERLAEIIAAANPSWEMGKHPATRSFQAIRIFLNRELEDLEALLPQLPDMLAPGGRFVAISFHSLEDRRIKRFIRDEARGRVPSDLPLRESQIARRLKPIGKAVRATEEEVARNPRSRSAVMRVAERS